MEYLVLNRKTGRQISSEIRFVRRFWVFVYQPIREVCGLYYGDAMSWVGPEGEETQNPTAGLTLSMTDLIQGIKRQVGVEVSLSLP